jgi:hypothetical protein
MFKASRGIRGARLRIISKFAYAFNADGNLGFQQSLSSRGMGWAKRLTYMLDAGSIIPDPQRFGVFM